MTANFQKGMFMLSDNDDGSKNGEETSAYSSLTFSKNFKSLYDTMFRNARQEDVARKLGVTQSKLSKCISGSQGLQVEHLEQLRRNYSVNLNWLIADDGEPLTRPDFGIEDIEPFICHLLFQQDQKELATSIAGFFYGIKQAVSVESPDLLLPNDIGIADQLAHKHVQEATSIVCIVSNGHNKMVNKWKELSIADNPNQKGENSKKRIFYAVTKSGERYIPDLVSLKNAKVSVEKCLFSMDNENDIKELLEKIIENRKRSRIFSRYDLPDINSIIDSSIIDTNKTIANIKKVGSCRICFIAGSVPEHIKNPKKLPANSYKDLVYWEQENIPIGDDFSEQYIKRLRDFVKGLCHVLGIKYHFQFSSSALVKNVGEEVIKFCINNDIPHTVEGIHLSSTQQPQHDSFFFQKFKDKYLNIELETRKKYLSNKEALIVIGGNDGTQSDIQAAKALNKDAERLLHPEIKIIPIPCFGGVATATYLEAGNIHRPTKCQDCQGMSEECYESIAKVLEE
jgi:transcriptional regulator with XRE-family HTH domain